MILILGTAQIGLKYGITNSSEKPDINESLDILNTAFINNITYYDTAQCYGDSEYKLGIFKKNNNKITIITKLKIDENSDIDKQIEQSLNNLQSEYIDILLLHEYKYLKNTNYFNKLLKYKSQNIIKNIGISVYTVDEAIVSMKNEYIKYIQIPFNIIDQSWINNNEFQRLLKIRSDIFICVRSIFLQGILINDFHKWPKINAIKEKEIINNLDFLRKKFGFNNKIELCVSYVKSIDWINGCIFGIDNKQQLLDNINLFEKTKKMSNSQIKYVQKKFNNIDQKILDPRLW